MSINRKQSGIRSAVIPRIFVIADLVLFFLSNPLKVLKTIGTVMKGVKIAMRMINNGIINASSGIISAIYFMLLVDNWVTAADIFKYVYHASCLMILFAKCRVFLLLIFSR